MKKALLFCAALLGCDNKMPPPLDGSMPPKDGQATTDAAVDGDAAPDVVVPPVCDPKMTFGAANAVPGIAAGDKILGAITPDERTIAWVTPQGTVLYADRADATQPFGNAQTLAGTYEHERVALSSDGLTLIVVMTGASTFGQVTRASRSASFGSAPDITPFKNVAGMPTEGDSGPMGTHKLGDPVLSADGKLLWFSLYNQGVPQTFALTEKFGSGWLKALVLTQTELVAQAMLRRRPTGIASDGLTIFFFDEVDQKEKAAWRKTKTSFDTMFTGIVDLADRKGAQPNAACTRLYFSSPLAPPQDLKLANKN